MNISLSDDTCIPQVFGFFFFNCLFVSGWAGGEGRRERGREKTKESPCCQCKGGRGLDPKNCEIMTLLETKSQILND